jgi:NADH-quinone oxidoreductase subunit H
MNDSQLLHQVGALGDTAYVLTSIVKLLVIYTAVMLIVAMLTLLERKIAGWIQDRLGPNRVGPSGLLQPIADGLKNILKEETNPGQANSLFFTMAPMMSIIPALVSFAVIPIAAPLPTRWGLVEMVIADVPIGILFLLAFSSLGVYGVVIAGWASANKYAMLGGMRAAAQLISYEIGLGMSLLSVYFLVGNVRMPEMVARQQEMGLWFALPLALSFFLFWISAFAETNRLPFDMPEAEAELIAGYHTEYSAMKFSMYFIAEYAHVFVVSMVMATLFLGGWDIPGWAGDNMRVVAPGVVEGAAPAVWKTIVTLIAFLIKTMFFVVFFMLVRWTVPRFRYDQIMDLGWKFMIPAGLVAVVATSATILALEANGVAYGLGYGLVLTVVNVALFLGAIFLLDRGRILTGTGPYTERHLAERQARLRRHAELTGAAPVAGD